MKSPFIFGRVVTGSSFVNRTVEINRISGNFQNHVNTILISPRRWGKSSLVQKTADVLFPENQDILICFIDLFKIRTEEEFFRQFASAVIRSSSGRIEEWINNVKDFLSKVSPGISFGADPLNDFQVNFSLMNGELDKVEILELPEKIALKKKKHIIICIDEFQNIGNYADSLNFQKLLRSVWQLQQNTTYCIYGSKRHMMIEFFESPSMPFYKFGDLIFLQKIEKQIFSDYIKNAFSGTGKSIDTGICMKIVELTEAHPYFVQQLAHIVWINTVEEVSEEIFDFSVNQLIEQNSILYQEITGALSNTQLNFLIALAKGLENFTSKDIIRRFDLGTSANVIKIKKMLIAKEIIDSADGKTIFQDPIFRRWILTVF